MKIKIKNKSQHIFYLVVTLILGIIMLTSLIIMITAFVEPFISLQIKMVSVLAASIMTVLTYILMIALIEYWIDHNKL